MLGAIRQQLAEDDALEQEATAPPAGATRDTLFAELRTLREAIITERGGRPLDLDAILDEVRHERDDELLPLR